MSRLLDVSYVADGELVPQYSEVERCSQCRTWVEIDELVKNEDGMVCGDCSQKLEQDFLTDKL